MFIRLSKEDRDRLGAPELVEYDQTKLMRSEAVMLKVATGFTVQRLMQRLAGETCPEHKGHCGRCKRSPCERHAVGVPCQDHTDALDEECEACDQPCEECGNADPEALGTIAWLALRRAGLDVPYDVDLNLLGLSVVDDPNGDAGSN